MKKMLMIIVLVVIGVSAFSDETGIAFGIEYPSEIDGFTSYEVIMWTGDGEIFICISDNYLPFYGAPMYKVVNSKHDDFKRTILYCVKEEWSGDEDSPDTMVFIFDPYKMTMNGYDVIDR